MAVDIRKILGAVNEDRKAAAQGQVNKFNKQYKTGEAAQKMISGYGDFDVYTNGRKEQVTNEDPFTSIAKGVVSPFVNFGAGLGEMSVKRDPRDPRSQKPTYMDPEEYEQFLDNPFAYQAKNLAGMASYAIPMGGGIAANVGKAALAGGLQGISQADLRDPNSIIENVGGGALLGGGTAGVLGALGKGVQALTKSGVDEAVTSKFGNTLDETKAFGDAVTGEIPNQNFLQRQGLNMQASSAGMTALPVNKSGTIKLSSDFNKTVNSIEQARQFFGAPKGLKGLEQMTDNMSDLLENSILESKFTTSANQLFDKDTIAELARRAGKEIPETEISGIVQSKLFKYLPELKNSGASLDDIVNGKIKLSAPDLLTLKRATYDASQKVVGKGSDKIDDLVADRLHEFAKNTLNEKIPGVSQINSTFQKLFAQNKGLVQAFNTGQKGAQIASPTGLAQMLYNKSSGVAGRGLEAIGNVAQKGIIPQKASNTIQSSLGILGQVAPRIAATQAGMQQVAPEEQPTMTSYQSSNSDMGPQLAMALIESGYSPNEAKTMIELLGVGGGEKTEFQRKFAGAQDTAKQALSLLESGKVQTGKLAGVRSGVETFFDTQDNNVTDYQSMIANARTLLRNALLGSSVSAGESASLEASIPDFNDEPRIAKQKLKSFISNLETFMQ